MTREVIGLKATWVKDTKRHMYMQSYERFLSKKKKKINLYNLIPFMCDYSKPNLKINIKFYFNLMDNKY